MSDSYYSNCLIETWRHRRALRRVGIESYRITRPSRFRWSPFHQGWGVRDVATGMIRFYSFKPVDGKDVPLYMAWTRLLFKGRVVEGDAP